MRVPISTEYRVRDVRLGAMVADLQRGLKEVDLGDGTFVVAAAALRVAAASGTAFVYVAL